MKKALQGFCGALLFLTNGPEKPQAGTRLRRLLRHVNNEMV